MYWGTLTQNTDQESELRPEFKGNEEFSHSNHRVNRNDDQNRGTLFAILNFLVVTFFVTVCVSSFFFSKQYSGEFAGVINGMIIGTTNFTYRKCLVPLVNLENHKFKEKYNESFVKKLFVFQFINANMGIFYTIYKDRKLKELAFLLLG